MNREELAEVLRLHRLWLKGEEGGVRADLGCSTLVYANLIKKDLSFATLSGADLNCADLRCATLSGADLNCADLTDTLLSGCIGNSKEIRNINRLDYRITYTEDVIAIGCEQHSHEEWMYFSEDEIYEMDEEKSLIFWKENKEAIFKEIEESFGKAACS